MNNLPLVHEIGEPINGGGRGEERGGRINQLSYQGYFWIKISCKSAVLMLKS